VDPKEYPAPLLYGKDKVNSQQKEDRFPSQKVVKVLADSEPI